MYLRDLIITQKTFEVRSKRLEGLGESCGLPCGPRQRGNRGQPAFRAATSSFDLGQMPGILVRHLGHAPSDASW